MFHARAPYRLSRVQVIQPSSLEPNGTGVTDSELQQYYQSVKIETGDICMTEIHSQSQRVGESWNAAPMRAVGLYGELQPLPLPVPAPLAAAMTRKPGPRRA